MKTYEIEEDSGKVALYLGDTKGGLTMIHTEACYRMRPDDARDMAEELISIADKIDGKG